MDQLQKLDGELDVADSANPPLDLDGIAGALRHRLGPSFHRPDLPDRIGEFAAHLARLREKVLSRVKDGGRRAEIMKKLAAPPSYEAFVTGGAERMEELFEVLTKACPPPGTDMSEA